MGNNKIQHALDTTCFIGKGKVKFQILQ